MELKELISPINGLFANMPQDIWGNDFDPAFVDIELFTRIGNLEASPLVEYCVQNGVLDIEKLSNILYQRYHKNWQKIWDALLLEYNILTTSSLTEKRVIEHESKSLETRDLTDESTGTVEDDRTLNLIDTRTGGSTQKSKNINTKDLTDEQVINTTSDVTESGTEGLKDTFKDKVSTDSKLTYAGSEISDVDSTDTHNMTKADSGTISDSGTKTQTGNGSTVSDIGKYGVGSSALAKDTNTHNSDTRNYTDTDKNTRTLGTSEATSGTVGTKSKDTKTFNGRNDHTVNTEDHTGTIEHDTTFGKKVGTKDGGSVTNSQSGTDTDEMTASETFDNLQDAHTGTEKNANTRDVTDKSTGTIGTDGSDKTTDDFTSEGSSPLRTYQALIQEELDGRAGEGWNFTNLIITDVQKMIASKIWRRTHGAF